MQTYTSVESHVPPAWQNLLRINTAFWATEKRPGRRSQWIPRDEVLIWNAMHEWKAISMVVGTGWGIRGIQQLTLSVTTSSEQQPKQTHMLQISEWHCWIRQSWLISHQTIIYVGETPSLFNWELKLVTGIDVDFPKWVTHWWWSCYLCEWDKQQYHSFYRILP